MYIGFSNLSLGSNSKLIPMGCFTRGYDALDSMLISAIGPIFLAALVMLWAAARLKNKTEETLRKKISRQHFSAVVMISFFMLPTACTAIFRTFFCKQFDGDENSFLIADYSVQCFTTRHNLNVFIAVCFVFVYVRTADQL